MKVGDKVWIPVEVVDARENGTAMVQYSCYKGDRFCVDDADIQTVTAEDYRNALNEFYGMGTDGRKKIWKFSFMGDALGVTAEEFVSRLRKYQDEPKMGQIWKAPTGKKIVIFKADESEVHYFTPSGFPTWSEIDYFENNFRNTGEVLTSIDTFLKDLEGLNEKG